MNPIRGDAQDSDGILLLNLWPSRTDVKGLFSRVLLTLPSEAVWRFKFCCRGGEHRNTGTPEHRNTGTGDRGTTEDTEGERSPSVSFAPFLLPLLTRELLALQLQRLLLGEA
jgi:hypothetical protein